VKGGVRGAFLQSELQMKQDMEEKGKEELSNLFPDTYIFISEYFASLNQNDPTYFSAPSLSASQDSNLLRVLFLFS
jgi:hypothetical protein